MFVVKRILLALNIIVALLLLATYLPTHVFFGMNSFVSLLGYIYPIALILNIIFILLWLLIGSRWNIILSLACILLHYDFVPRLYNLSFGKEEKENTLTILSYNVEGFNHDINLFEDRQSKQDKQKENLDSIISIVANSKADIVCFQDFVENIACKENVHNRMTEGLKYRYHFHYYKIYNKRISDCVIYSKYFIRDAGNITDSVENSTNIWADILTPYGELRVYNLHLLSYQLADDSKDTFSKLKSGDLNDKSGIKTLAKKLVYADNKRKYQADNILNLINDCEKPYIIVGDFNSIPFSYVYKQFNAVADDSFVKKGTGLGRTYNGIFPAYRIDYVLTHKDKVKTQSYQSKKVDFSDHHPIVVKFSIVK